MFDSNGNSFFETAIPGGLSLRSDILALVLYTSIGFVLIAIFGVAVALIIATIISKCRQKRFEITQRKGGVKVLLEESKYIEFI